MGLLWVFPQGKDRAKVGCGDFKLNPRTEVKSYLSEKDHKLLKEISAKVRVIPPSHSKPFYVSGSPSVLGVGESIGTISPLSGEGIHPSLVCADIFLVAFKGEKNLERVAQKYESKVLKKYRWADEWFNFLKSVRYGRKINQLRCLFQAPVPSWASGTVSKLKLVFWAPFR
ncbi:hypothetical protein AKJ61_01310 [candidate division MSBL1 archaeon SCGC-AAA259B11]|uniref:FAD-binding domain-containing protein n=1 Tax=candidate division MSBL1 archaeon SCGC-AAA259B11 TaxID=1698260 RepID=A0A133U7J8_9EURY|nr:hypothetical protein AKJ61_01310 [candidate division MSBL1 archaeon SCGC-AAA259B11]